MARRNTETPQGHETHSHTQKDKRKHTSNIRVTLVIMRATQHKAENGTVKHHPDKKAINSVIIMIAAAQQQPQQQQQQQQHLLLLLLLLLVEGPSKVRAKSLTASPFRV